MSDQNENTMTITSAPDGTFKINTGSKEHSASYRNQGGADVVQMGQEYVERDKARAARGDVFRGSEGTIEINDDGQHRILGVETYEPVPHGNNFDVLSNITDLSGRRVNDLSLVRQSPANYKATIGRTEATVESLLHAGVLQIQGDGKFVENVPRKMILTNPRDKSNPEYEAPKVEKPILMADPLREMVSEDIAKAGFDPAAIFAQAIGNGSSAAKTVTDAMGDGTTPEEFQEVLLTVVKTTLKDCGVMMEREGMVEKGHGAIVLDFAMNECDPKVGKRILHGLMLGQRAAYEEAIHRFLFRDKY